MKTSIRYVSAGMAAALAAAAAAMTVPAAAQTAMQAEGRPEASPIARVAKARAEARKNGESGRVIGGTAAEPGAWPFQVALLSSDMLDSDPATQFDAQFCGGSLISAEWVLTAAHCLFQWGETIEPGSVTVLVGATGLDEGERIPVAEIIAHESYDPQGFDHDVGLIRLAHPAKQAPVALTKEDVESGPATVTGWGKMDDGGFPDTLMQADLELFGNNACNAGIKEIYARDIRTVLENYGRRMRVSQAGIDDATKFIASSMSDPLTGNMLCAGTPSGARDACNGDSGGPLFTTRGDRPVQVGIVSWGEGPMDADMACGHENAYGIYTRVAKFSDWIAGKTGVR